MQSNILLLASKSPQRRTALEQARIPFRIIEQDADESICDYMLPFGPLIESIAIHKMNHVVMPVFAAQEATSGTASFLSKKQRLPVRRNFSEGASGRACRNEENDIIKERSDGLTDLKNTPQFVLTVDTMVQDGTGKIYGKPSSKEEARSYIQALRDNPGQVGTAFCLDKKQFIDNTWQTIDRITKFVSAGYALDISDHWIDTYFEQVPEYLSIAGGLTIEEYGAQFLKTIDGSYGCAIGLPLYELRESLEIMGFFSKESK